MKFLKQFSLYTLVGVVGAGVNFLLMPYLSHYIMPAEYGVMSMVISYIGILVPLVGLVASGIINVDYFKIPDRTEFASLFSSIQVIPVIPSVLFFAVALLFPAAIADFFEIPHDKSYWVPLSVVVAVLSIYFETLLAFSVTEQNALSYTVLYLFKTLTDVTLTVLFVVHLSWGWEGRLWAMLITTVVFFIVSLVLFNQKSLLTLNIKRKYVVTGIVFGLPLILHTIGKFVINQSDRIFIAKMVSLEEAGIYNIGYQAGSLILLFVNAAGNFYAPFLYERLSAVNAEANREIVKVSYLIIAGLFVCLIGISLSAPYFFTWLVDEKYYRGVAYVFWVGLSYFFWGVYIVFSTFIFYSKKTKVLGYIAVLNVVLNIILNYILILKFGALGAAYATAISFFVVSFVVGWHVLKNYNLPWTDLKGAFLRNRPV